MAARLCWENIEPRCDPLSPGNPICIANGIFAGTPAPVGGKFGLASKSPMTGFIGDSLSGSWFSIALKRAGWDGVVIHGASEDWVWVFIDDDRVEFLSASHLLGLGTFETEEAIRAQSQAEIRQLVDVFIDAVKENVQDEATRESIRKAVLEALPDEADAGASESGDPVLQ